MSIKDFTKVALVSASALFSSGAEAQDIQPYRIYTHTDPILREEELVSFSSCKESGLATGVDGQTFEVGAYVHNGNHGKGKPDYMGLSMVFVDIAQHKDANPVGCLKVTQRYGLDMLLHPSASYREHFEKEYGSDFIGDIERRGNEILLDLRNRGPYPFF